MWKRVFISPCKIAVNCLSMSLQGATSIFNHISCSAIETREQRGPSRRSCQSVYAVHKECLNGNIRAPWISNVAIRKQQRSGSANCSSELWEQSARPVTTRLLISINWSLHISWKGDCQRPVRCNSAAGGPESVAWTALTLKGNKCSLLQSVTVYVYIYIYIYITF